MRNMGGSGRKTQRGGKEGLAELLQDSTTQLSIHPAVEREPDALCGSSLKLSLRQVGRLVRNRKPHENSMAHDETVYSASLIVAARMFK